MKNDAGGNGGVGDGGNGGSSGASAGSGGVGGTAGAIMISIPAATFTIGESDDTLINRLVTFGAFQIDKTEVTVEAYAACVTAGSCTAAGTGGACNWGVAGHNKHPINCGDWNQAVAFCSWSGKRLPTAEEWEYAARRPDERFYPWGSTPEDATKLNANLPADSYPDGTAPVGTYSPAGDTVDGLEDMAGNVWEWMASPYCPNDPTVTCNEGGPDLRQADQSPLQGGQIVDSGQVGAGALDRHIDRHWRTISGCSIAM